MTKYRTNPKYICLIKQFFVMHFECGVFSFQLFYDVLFRQFITHTGAAHSKYVRQARRHSLKKNCLIYL